MSDLSPASHLLPRHIANVGTTGLQSLPAEPPAPVPAPHKAVVFREVRPDDLAAVHAIVRDCNLCKSVLLEGMTASHFGNPASRDTWLAADMGSLAAVACYAPERLTEGTWMLHLIAVHPEHQGRGLGSQLLTQIERTLSRSGQRALLIGTSALPQYRLTRSFYRKAGYAEIARIPAYYQAGDDQVLFRKAL